MSLTDEKYLRLLEMLADQLKIKDDKIIILQYQLEALEKRLADAEHLARYLHATCTVIITKIYFQTLGKTP